MCTRQFLLVCSVKHIKSMGKDRVNVKIYNASNDCGNSHPYKMCIRDSRNMITVDEMKLYELVDDACASANPYVFAALGFEPVDYLYHEYKDLNHPAQAVHCFV